MNPVLREAARAVEHPWVMGIVTAAFILLFIAWVVWVFARPNRESLDEAARLPLTTGDDA